MILNCSGLGGKIIAKWKNVRDNYKRFLNKRSKSGQGADGGRQYVYSRQLSFLNASSDPASTDSSIQEEVTHSQKEVTVNTKSSPRNVRKTAATRRQQMEDSIIKYMNTPIPSQPPNPTNPNMAFFESLLPALDTFTVDDRIEFQGDVLNLVKKIRSRYTSAQHSFGSPYSRSSHSSHYQPPLEYPSVSRFHPYQPFPDSGRCVPPVEPPVTTSSGIQNSTFVTLQPSTRQLTNMKSQSHAQNQLEYQPSPCPATSDESTVSFDFFSDGN